MGGAVFRTLPQSFIAPPIYAAYFVPSRGRVPGTRTRADGMGWILAGILVVLGGILAAVKFGGGGGVFTTILFVPDGLTWRQFYRRLQEGQGRGLRKMPATWIVIGIGVGVAIIAVIFAVVAR